MTTTQNPITSLLMYIYARAGCTCLSKVVRALPTDSDNDDNNADDATTDNPRLDIIDIA